jgi:hypothetical protein
MFSCHKSYPRLDRAVEEHIFPVKLHLFWKNDRWIWLKLAGAEASALATAAVCACTRCALAYLWSRYPQAEGGSAASKSVHSLVGGASASTWRWMDKIGRIPSARCIRLISSVLICASPAMCCSSSSTVFHHVGALHLWYLYRWPVCYSYATLRTYGTLGREKKRKEKES